MSLIQIIIFIVAFFYVFLWTALFFINAGNKPYRYTMVALKGAILVPFWFLIVLNTVNLFLPLSFSGSEETMAVRVSNTGGQAAKVVFLGQYYQDPQWYIVHPYPESKNRALFEAPARKMFDSITVSRAIERIFALDVENTHSGIMLNTADSSSIDLASAKLSAPDVVNTNFEWEQSILYLLAVVGLWYHVAAYKEKESRVKFIAGAVIASILCAYIIYNYLNIVIRL